MLLKIVSDDEAIIKPRTFTTTTIPEGHRGDQGSRDRLAISQRKARITRRSCPAKCSTSKTRRRSISGPSVQRARHVLQFPPEGEEHFRRLGGANLFFVEDVAYQKAAIQEMERALLPVVPMKPQGDKRARLQVVAPYIKNGTVLFLGRDVRNCSGRCSILASSHTTTYVSMATR